MKPKFNLVERRRAVVAKGVGQFTGDATAVSAHGARITDEDGHEWIDLAGGIGVMNVGHCNAQVVAAIREQAGKLLHACIHVATYEPYVALCEELVGLLPHGGPTKAVLLNSGAEAVENAIKIARQATRRDAVICFTDAFHGRTLLGMSLTSKTTYKRGCGPFAPEVYRLPYPDRFHNGDGLDEAAFVKRELARLEDAFTNRVEAEHVAAIIIEPVLGEGGSIPAPAAYMRGLRKICDQRGIMLIVDEVQTGFGRTGAWGAFEHSGIIPDLSTWAKSMGGGMPISAVLGKAEIMDTALPGTLGGTYGGNPVACAAALATIRAMRALKLNERGAQIGAIIRKRLDALARRSDWVGDVRGLGAMIGLELSHQRDPARPAKEAMGHVLDACRAHRVMVIPASRHANVLRVLSPLVISDEDLNFALDVIEESVLSIPQAIKA